MMAREYWIDAREWSEDELTSTSIQIADLVASGAVTQGAKDKQNCEFLFALSKKSLADIAGNYFWPSAYREVSNRSCRKYPAFTEGKFAKVFREAIREAYRKEIQTLERQGIHHKYVALIFQQAGIGKDRNRLILEFLEFLMEQDPYSWSVGSDTHAIVSAALNEFVRRLPESSRSDVRFLSGVLLRVGQQVVVLVPILERHPERTEIVTWPWGKIREFWRSRSGIDLDELTPSAEVILLEFITRLSATWQRKEVFRLAKSGKVSVVLPGAITLSDCKGYREIPIGPAQIRSRGKDHYVMVVDRTELDPGKLFDTERDVWNWLEDGYRYKFSNAMFEVVVNGCGRQKAVPVFEGNRPSSAIRTGYYWGGGPALEVMEAAKGLDGAATRVRPQLAIYSTFRWRDGKLRLVVRGFSASLPTEEKCTLEVGGVQMWNGRLDGVRPDNFEVKAIDIANPIVVDAGNVEAKIITESGKSLERAIAIWPLADDAFLVVDGRLHRSGSSVLLWESNLQPHEVILLATSGDGKPELGNLSITRTDNTSILDRSYTQWRLREILHEEARIRLKESWWNIDFRPAMELEYPESKDLKKDGVSISTVGNIRAIDDIAGMLLQTSEAVLIADGKLGVWVTALGEETFCKLEESDWVSDGKVHWMNLADILARNYVDVATGLIQVNIGTAQAKGTMDFNFFLVPDCISPRNGRILDHSVITLGMGDSSYDVKSEDVVSLAFLDEGKFVKATSKGPDWELWFRWKPRIFDLTINGESGAAVDYSYDLSRKISEAGICELRCHLCSDGNQQPAHIEFLNKHIAANPSMDIDLAAYLSGRDIAPEEEIKVVAVQGPDRVEWKLNLDAVVKDIETHVEAIPPQNVLFAINVHIGGFRREILTVNLYSGDTLLEGREIRFDPHRSSAQRMEMQLVVAAWDLNAENIEIAVLRNETVIKKASVQVPKQEPIGNGGSLEVLMAAYRSTNSFKLLPQILEQSIEMVATQDKECATKEIRTIMPRIGGLGGDHDDEAWLNFGLKCLEYACAESVRQVQIPLEKGKSPDLRALSLSLWLLLADRLAFQGKLDPRQLGIAMANLKNAIAAMRSSLGWERDLCIAAYRFAEDLPLRYGIPLTDYKDGEDDMELSRGSKAVTYMSSISRSFQSWMEKR